jgi:hypothetical protein
VGYRLDLSALDDQPEARIREPVAVENASTQWFMHWTQIERAIPQTRRSWSFFRQPPSPVSPSASVE